MHQQEVKLSCILDVPTSARNSPNELLQATKSIHRHTTMCPEAHGGQVILTTGYKFRSNSVMYTACIKMRVAIHRTKKVTKMQQPSCSTAEVGQQQKYTFRTIRRTTSVTYLNHFYDSTDSLIHLQALKKSLLVYVTNYTYKVFKFYGCFHTLSFSTFL